MKTKRPKNFIRLIFLVSCIMSVLLSGCGTSGSTEQDNSGSQSEPQSIEFFAMDTYMTLSAYGDNAGEVLEKGESLIKALEDKISTEKRNSQIATLNRNRKGNIDEDVQFLLKKSLSLYNDTGGDFNIAIYPVMKAWGFTTKKYRVPSKQKLRRLVSRMDLSTLSISKNGKHAYIGQAGMEIDLGGIAKGYASAKVSELFKDNGIENAIINLGGNVQVVGSKPDGSKWRVAIRSPFNDDDYLGILDIADKAAVTSGGYERNFTKNGKTYHHIMDPENGFPAEKGLVSVTVVSDDGTLADGLSTSLYIMGKQKAIDYWRKHSDRFDAILMDTNKKIYVTNGLEGSFESETYDFSIVD